MTPKVLREPRIRDASPADEEALRRVVKGIENFSGEEKSCAVELIEQALAEPGGDPEYRLLCAATPDEALSGFLLYGPADFTQGVWELYWIAVAREARRQGTGRRLLRAFEARARRLRGRMLLITTTSRADYEAARRAYRTEGFDIWARIADYYGPGEDQLIYGKRILTPARGGP